MKKQTMLPKVFLNILLIILAGQFLYTIYMIWDMLCAGYLTVGRVIDRTYASELISTNVLRTVLYSYIFLKVKSYCSNYK